MPQVLGDQTQALRIIEQQVLLGVVRADVTRNENHTYVADFQFSETMDDPTQEAADDAVSKISAEISSGKTRLVFTRTDATKFTIVAT
jgi:hypothetical protein